MEFVLKGSIKKGLLTSTKGVFKNLCGAITQRFSEMILEEGVDESRKDRFALEMRIHPAARPFQLFLEAPAELTILAETASVGPGYHQYLCDNLLDICESQKTIWNDSYCADRTSYVSSRSRRALEASFFAFAGDGAAEILDLPPGGDVAASFCMPTPYRFYHNRAAQSVLGPRDRKWLEQIAEQPMTAAEAFPWWRTDRDAAYYLGRALSMLWLELPPRPPIYGREQMFLNDMLNSLERAYTLNPNLLYPWREWEEFLVQTSHAGELTRLVGERARMESMTAPLAGYRRRPFQAVLPSGWMIRVPGVFAEDHDPGTGKWKGWYAGRSIQLEELPLPVAPGTRPAKQILHDLRPFEVIDGDHFDWNRGDLASAACVHPAAGPNGRVWKLESVTVGPLNILRTTVIWEQENQRSWAMDTWNSIAYASHRRLPGLSSSEIAKF